MMRNKEPTRSKTPREIGTLAKLAYAPVGLAYRGGKDVVKGANNVRPLRALKGVAELGLLTAALA
jgi:hypothetical protein